MGPLQLPVFGLLATAGIVAAMLLSQRTAALAGLDPHQLWDAGVIAVVSAFMASRMLLVLANFRLFVRHPLLVLAQPSLTVGGLAITAVLVCTWLRRKHLPLLDVLDAWTPSGALLWAVLSLGHFVQGTDAGMPTELPWGVVLPTNTVLGKVHPVQLYAMGIAAWLSYRSMRSLKIRRFAGQIAATTLLLQSLLSFLLDMVRQPSESQGTAWLEPGQYVSLLMMMLSFSMLAWLYVPPPPLSRDEVATILEDFAHGRTKGFEHEAVEYGRFKDPLVLEAQEIVSEMFGPMNDEQVEEMLRQAQRLRVGPEFESKGT